MPPRSRRAKATATNPARNLSRRERRQLSSHGSSRPISLNTSSQSASRNESGFSLEELTYDINRKFNLIIRDAAEVTLQAFKNKQSLTTSEDQEEIEATQAKLNPFLISQVVALLKSNEQTNKRTKKPSLNVTQAVDYPQKLITKGLNSALENLIFFDGKDSMLRMAFMAFSLVFKKLSPVAPNGPVHKMLLQTITFLGKYIRLAGPTVSKRSAHFLSMLVHQAKLDYKLAEGAFDELLRVSQQLTMQSRSAANVMMGLQIAACLYNPKAPHHDLFFNVLSNSILNSKSKDVRRKAVQLIQVPPFVTEPSKHADFLASSKFASFKEVMLQTLLTRAMDVSTEVKIAAFKKMAALKLKFEDINDSQQRLILIRYSLSNPDARVLKAFLEFFLPTIVTEKVIKVTLGELRDFIKSRSNEEEKRKSHRRSSLIHKNTRRRSCDSQASQASVAENEETVSIVHSTLHLRRVLDFIDITTTFTDERFLEVLAIAVQGIFLGLQTHREKLQHYRIKILEKQKGKVSEEAYELLTELNLQLEGEEREMSEDMIMAAFAEATFFKYYELSKKNLEDDQIMEVSSDDEQSQASPSAPSAQLSQVLKNLVQTIEVENSTPCLQDLILLRVIYDLARIRSSERSVEFMEKIRILLPNYRSFAQVFRFLEKLPISNADQMAENRSMLAEWLKLAVELPLIDNDVECNSLVSMLMHFIGSIQCSFEDYCYLLPKKQFVLDDAGNLTSLDDEVDEARQCIPSTDSMANVKVEAPSDYRFLGVCREASEYIKPYTSEWRVVDTDDVVAIAVQIIKRLMGDDTSNQFMTEILQVISDVREYIEEPSEQRESSKESVQMVSNPCSFGLLSQVEPGPQEKGVEQVSYFSLLQKYAKLSQESKAQVQELREEEGTHEKEHVVKILAMARAHNCAVSESYLKFKLSFKRTLTLVLHLLKGCRANLNDPSLKELCTNIVMQGLQETEDIEISILVFQCVGLFSILDRALFLNYVKIFSASIIEALTLDFNQEETIQNYLKLRLTIISIKSVIDSLIFFGPDEDRQIQHLLFQTVLFCDDSRMRQVTIEGLCKLLFSMNVKHLLDEEDEEGSLEETNQAMMRLISHFILQWFDSTFNTPPPIVRQCLSQFFRHFVLFSEHQFKLQMQSLLQVVFAHLASAYWDDKAHKKVKREFISSLGPSHYQNSGSKGDGQDEEEGEAEQEELSEISEHDIFNDPKPELPEGGSQVFGRQIAEEIDIKNVLRTFCLIMDRDGIYERTTVHNFKLRTSMHATLLFSVCHINNMIFQKVEIVKNVIAPLIAWIKMSELDCLSHARAIQAELEKSAKMLVKPIQSVKLFQTALEGHIERLKESSPQDPFAEEEDEGERGSLSKQEAKDLFDLDIDALKEFFIFQVYEKRHMLTSKDSKTIKNENAFRSPKKLPRQRRGGQSSRNQSSGKRSASSRGGTRRNPLESARKSLDKIVEQEESFIVSSTERPQKLVRFKDEFSQKDRPVTSRLSKVDETEMARISRQHANAYFKSKQKKQESLNNSAASDENSQIQLSISKSKRGTFSVSASSVNNEDDEKEERKDSSRDPSAFEPPKQFMPKAKTTNAKKDLTQTFEQVSSEEEEEEPPRKPSRKPYKPIEDDYSSDDEEKNPMASVIQKQTEKLKRINKKQKARSSTADKENASKAPRRMESKQKARDLFPSKRTISTRRHLSVNSSVDSTSSRNRTQRR